MKTFREFITEKEQSITNEKIDKMLLELSEEEISELKVTLSEKEELTDEEKTTLEKISEEVK